MRLRYSSLYTGTAKFCLGLQLFIKEEYWTAIFKILLRTLSRLTFTPVSDIFKIAIKKHYQFTSVKVLLELSMPNGIPFVFIPISCVIKRNLSNQEVNVDVISNVITFLMLLMKV